MVLLIVKQETTRMGLNYISKSIFANSFENGWIFVRRKMSFNIRRKYMTKSVYITWNVKT